MSLDWQCSNTIFKLESAEKLSALTSLHHTAISVSRETQLHVNRPVELLALGDAFQPKLGKCKIQQKYKSLDDKNQYTLNILTASVAFTCYCFVLTANTYHENKTGKTLLHYETWVTVHTLTWCCSPFSTQASIIFR